MKKQRMIILCILLSMLLGVNALSAQEIDTEGDPQESEIAEFSDASGHSVYDGIIQEYGEAVYGKKALFEASLDNPDIFKEAYPHVGRFIPKMVYDWEEQIAYAYYDIDGNGIDELLIGYYGGSPSIFDIITTNGQEAICHFNEEWIGKGNNILIYQNGSIEWGSE